MSTVAREEELPPIGARPTVVLPSPAARWLVTSADERAFQTLLRRCYGETYSHGELYVPGALVALWETGRLMSLGEWDGDELVAHTGLWVKEPGARWMESGTSLSLPHRRVLSRREHEAVWQALLVALSCDFDFIHQSTTTAHRLAQRYAERHLRARPTGLIFEYTQGESLRGFPSAQRPMHALTMSTALRPQLARELCVPEGPHAEWLAELALAWGRTPRVVSASRSCGPLTVRVLDVAPGLGLSRRIVQDSADALGCASITRTGRVDLIHVPAREDLLGSACAWLQASGFHPVGVRLDGSGTDTIVFQHLEPRHAAASLADIELASEMAVRLVDGWKRAALRSLE